ncbi:hypothetical protein HHI36_014532 [Cryptolaemus montrouzieri]|uniref:Uncharacterized protein n=1 Tax=Cryptolaemus montrouzieri TaxID=559131 RepID=A0ABD2N3D8_9CUCU
MDDFKHTFKDRYYKRNVNNTNYSNICNMGAYKTCHRDSSRFDSKFSRRHERDNFHISQSTLCVPHHHRSPSKSTICVPHHRNSSKSMLRTSHQDKDRHVIDKDISTLPYYIVPVLYVPHKPLYEAKQIIEPQIYKAYHCRSKRQLVKGSEGCQSYPPKLANSKSLLNLYSKKTHKDYDDILDMCKDKKSDNYSFEYYDEYFKKYIEEKRSSSEISFCTEKSFLHIPASPKRSSKFLDETFDLGSEKRKSISKDFPELFGLYTTSKNIPQSMSPRTGEEIPTWDSPRTVNALIETELAANSCISAQTSFDTLKKNTGEDKVKETQGTQTFIKDIKKNVLVVPNDKFRRSLRKEPITEEVPRNMNSMYDTKDLRDKLSDGQLDRMRKKSFSSNRSTPRFSISRLTKSAVPHAFGTNKRVQ